MGAIAAVAGTVETVRNDEVLDRLRGVDGEAFDAVAEQELRELQRREAAYRADMDAIVLAGRTVLLVDDGLATGATMRAAVAAVRGLLPTRLVVAVPVAAKPACEGLRDVVDDVVCLAVPEPFRAVGAWYAEFSQTSDDEVRRALAAAPGT